MSWLNLKNFENTKKNHRGSATLFIIIIALVIAISVVYFFDFLKRNRSIAAYSLSRLEIQTVLLHTLGKIKKTIQIPPEQCPSEWKALRKMDITTTTSWEYVFPNDLSFFSQCLNLPQDLLDKINTLKVKAQKTVSEQDKSNGQAFITIDLEAQLKPRGEAITVSDRWNRLLKVQIATVEPFGLIIDLTQSSLSLGNTSKLTVHSPVLIRSSEKIRIERLLDVNRWNLTKWYDTIWISKPLETQLSEISAADFLNLVFQATEGWLLDNQLGEAQIPMELNLEAWSELIDYFYVYNDFMGYPLPESTPSSATSEDGSQRFDPQRAQINQFPDGSVLQSLEHTCQSDRIGRRGDNPYFFWYGRNQTIRLRFTPTNRFFCGSVYADRIQVTLEGNRDYLWAGQIYTRELIIEGAGHLHLINPLHFKSEPAWISSLSFTLYKIRGYLQHHRATIGKRWFLPIKVSQGSLPAFFLPQKAAQFLQPCGSYRCWPAQIDSWSWDALYQTSNWDKNVFFWLQEVL